MIDSVRAMCRVGGKVREIQSSEAGEDRNMQSLDNEISRVLRESEPPAGPGSILVYGCSQSDLEAMRGLLQDSPHRCVHTSSDHEAQQLLEADEFELLLYAPSGTKEKDLDFLGVAKKLAPATKIIVMTSKSNWSLVVNATRMGAIDVLFHEAEKNDVFDCVEKALIKTRRERQREQSLSRLRSVCRELQAARHEVAEQVEGLCQELAAAYANVDQQVQDAVTASEYRTLLRQDLDVEEALRTTLSYLISKIGPTNGAVFLPEGDGHYGLGAYANLDCPRESADSLLQAYAEVICPKLAKEEDIVLFEDAEELLEGLKIKERALFESQFMAFSCRTRQVCMAVVILFRSRETPFDPELSGTLELIREIFANHLERIVRVHHRGSEWPEQAKSDEIDFDNEQEGWQGGMAA